VRAGDLAAGDAPAAEVSFAPPLFENSASDSQTSPGGGLRVLGQLRRTFVLASDGDALLLVDQHAAHERIAYESIVASAREGRPGEPLLVPHVLELDGPRSAALDRVREALAEAGLDIVSWQRRRGIAAGRSTSRDSSTTSPRIRSSATYANEYGRRSRVIRSP
jgi:DNA mismatch repair ATPase MutL